MRLILAHISPERNANADEPEYFQEPDSLDDDPEDSDAEGMDEGPMPPMMGAWPAKMDIDQIFAQAAEKTREAQEKEVRAATHR